jgi:hypothetical protein
MRGELKRVSIGIAVIAGLQILLGILIAVAAQQQAETLIGGKQFNLLFLGVSLGTFFIGGLIIGFMEDRVTLSEPILAAVLAMLITSVAAVAGLPDTLLLYSYFTSQALTSFVMTVAVGLIATLGGGLIGERIRVPSEDDRLARIAVTIGLALVITGPFFLLTMSPFHLPWGIVIAAVVIVLALVGVAYYMFTRGETFEKSIEEISISPERRRET